jgi:hypothetical protein
MLWCRHTSRARVTSSGTPSLCTSDTLTTVVVEENESEMRKLWPTKVKEIKNSKKAKPKMD